MKRTRWLEALAGNSLLWATVLALAYYAMLHAGVLQAALGPSAGKFLLRYTASHPVEYVEVFLFLLGMASLFGHMQHLGTLTAIPRDPICPLPDQQRPLSQQAAQVLQSLPEKLASAPTLLMQRIRSALEFLHRGGSAEELSTHLAQLATRDQQQLQESLALVRIVVWAIPILGFLGTVVGITLAIANLDPKALESSLGTVVGGLGVAFDTTALALALSMVLMFTLFVVQRMQHRALAAVEQRVQEELMDRVVAQSLTLPAELAPVRHLAELLLQQTQQLVQNQVQLWQQALGKVQQQGAQLTQQVATASARALAQVLEKHSQHLAQLSHDHHRRLQSQLEQATQALQEHRQVLQEQLQLWQQQSDKLAEVLQAVAQIHNLEQALQRNLATLAASGNFEQTLDSLAAAIHLLNARVAQLPTGASLTTPADRAA